MNNITHFFDVYFKNTVGRRISDHAGSQVVFVGFCLGAEVFQVDITVFVAFNSNSRITALDSTGRISSVGRCRKQYDISMSLSDAFEISADDTKSGIFAGGT